MIAHTLYKKDKIRLQQKVTEPKYETVTTKTNLVHGTHGGFYHQDLLKGAMLGFLSREDHEIPICIGTNRRWRILQENHKSLNLAPVW